MSIHRIGLFQAISSYIMCGTKSIKNGFKVMFVGIIAVLTINYLHTLLSSHTNLLGDFPANTIKALSGFVVFGYVRKVGYRLQIQAIDILFIISAYTGVATLLPANFRKIFVTRG